MNLSIDGGSNSSTLNPPGQSELTQEPSSLPQPSSRNGDLQNVRGQTEIQYFDTKQVEWTDRTGFRGPVNILLQNDNGPCPLVALINTMVFTSPATAAYTSGKERISVKGLLEYLGELLLEKVSAADGAQSSEIINDTDDVLRLLPKLVTGLNIDPMFDGQFSNSPEMSLFRLYGVDVVHGWLVDPHEPIHHHVIEAESYEHSQMLLIEASEAQAMLIRKDTLVSSIRTNTTERENPLDEKPTPTLDTGNVQQPVPGHVPERPGVFDHSENTSVENQKIDSQGEGYSVAQSQSSSLGKPSSNSPPPPKPVDRPEATKLFKDIYIEPTSAPSPLSSNDGFSAGGEDFKIVASRSYSLPEEEKAAEAEELLSKANSVRKFLDQYPTQLTEYGISFLKELLPPGNLAVFFRNDHFSTIYNPVNPEQPLMILVTDAGFATKKNIVWHSLSSISGQNDNFYDSQFRISPLDVSNDRQADVPGMSDGKPLHEVSDFELARQLQQEEDHIIAQMASQAPQRQSNISPTARLAAQTPSRQPSNRPSPTSNKKKSTDKEKCIIS